MKHYLLAIAGAAFGSAMPVIEAESAEEAKLIWEANYRNTVNDVYEVPEDVVEQLRPAAVINNNRTVSDYLSDIFGSTYGGPEQGSDSMAEGEASPPQADQDEPEKCPCPSCAIEDKIEQKVLELLSSLDVRAMEDASKIELLSLLLRG